MEELSSPLLGLYRLTGCSELSSLLWKLSLLKTVPSSYVTTPSKWKSSSSAWLMWVYKGLTPSAQFQTTQKAMPASERPVYLTEASGDSPQPSSSLSPSLLPSLSSQVWIPSPLSNKYLHAGLHLSVCFLGIQPATGGTRIGTLGRN